MAELIQVKRGDTFDFLVAVPESYADGYWTGWTVASQIRDTRGRLIADLTATWQDPEEDTRVLRLFQSETAAWPIGTHELDIQFTHTANETVISTVTQPVEVLRDVTQP